MKHTRKFALPTSNDRHFLYRRKPPKKKKKEEKVKPRNKDATNYLREVGTQLQYRVIGRRILLFYP